MGGLKTAAAWYVAYVKLIFRTLLAIIHGKKIAPPLEKILGAPLAVGVRATSPLSSGRNVCLIDATSVVMAFDNSRLESNKTSLGLYFKRYRSLTKICLFIGVLGRVDYSGHFEPLTKIVHRKIN